MRYLRTIKMCTRQDIIKNKDIRKEMKMHPVQNKTDEQRQNWRI
jgi:hypothetical protein